MMIEYKSFKSYDTEEIFYIELGEGRPLVYVVGFGDTVEMAYPHALRWSERFHCVLFDHRGYGKTPLTSKGGVEESARDLHSLLCALNLDDVVLVGYSMGGSVAFSYFEQFGSERIGKLVLLDTNPKLINDSSWNLGLWQGLYTSEDYEHDLRVIEENPPLFHLSFFVRASTPIKAGAPTVFPDTDDLDGWFDRALQITGLRERFLRKVFFKEVPVDQRRLERLYWESMTGGNWLRVIEKIDVPTKCIFADPGSFYSPRTGEWLATRLPQGTLETLSNATHMCPKEKFEDLVGIVERFGMD